jgi:hypothetical protein
VNRRGHLTALLASLALAGCGITDPYAGNPPAPSPDRPAPSAHHARPTTLPAASAPQRVAAAYAIARGTFTAATYPAAHRRMRELATAALARRLFELTPSHVSTILRDTKTQSTTTVLTSHLEEKSRARATVVVAAAQTTRTASENGLPAPRYLFARTRLSKTPAGWRVAAFEVLP